MENSKPNIKEMLLKGLIFLAGILLGAMLLFGTGHIYLKSYMAAKGGMFLDQDRVELKNGDTIMGHVSDIRDNQYYLTMNSGSMVLNTHEVKHVTKNVNARYLKELW